MKLCVMLMLTVTGQTQLMVVLMTDSVVELSLMTLIQWMSKEDANPVVSKQVRKVSVVQDAGG